MSIWGIVSFGGFLFGSGFVSVGAFWLFFFFFKLRRFWGFCWVLVWFCLFCFSGCFEGFVCVFFVFVICVCCLFWEFLFSFVSGCFLVGVCGFLFVWFVLPICFVFPARAVLAAGAEPRFVCFLMETCLSRKNVSIEHHLALALSLLSPCRCPRARTRTGHRSCTTATPLASTSRSLACPTPPSSSCTLLTRYLHGEHSAGTGTPPAGK